MPLIELIFPILQQILYGRLIPKNLAYVPLFQKQDVSQTKISDYWRAQGLWAEINTIIRKKNCCNQ